MRILSARFDFAQRLHLSRCPEPSLVDIGRANGDARKRPNSN
jgi:hypothetical protein